MINKQSSIPIYQQLKELLREHIEKELKPGDAIPTEPEIEKTYDVSRMTVRKAIDELVAEDLVVKKQGKGTFVQPPKITEEMGGITSWTEEMRQRGQEAETTGLEIKEISPSRKLTSELRLDKNEKVISLKRIRTIHEEPIAIMVNYLRAKFIPGFIKSGLQKESLYEHIESVYGIYLDKANELIQAREATELEAEALNISPYASVLHITRVSYLPNDVPFELVEMTARADRYQYRITLNGRKRHT